MTSTSRTPGEAPSSAQLLTVRSLVLIGFIVAAAASRLLPHAWNFTPVEAMALFGGAYFAHRAMAFVVPLGALLLSDLFLGFYALMPVVYGCVALCVLLGFALRGRVRPLRVAAMGLGGAVLFFLITNFAVWATADAIGGYDACSAGLMSCYVFALPFFKGTLAGTAVWSLVLFGGFELLRRGWPQLGVRRGIADSVPPDGRAIPMGNRLSKIYTRTGDDGSTGLGDGTRVAKDSARVTAYGTVDELNSCLGVLLAQQLSDEVRADLVRIQHQLFDLGGELCIPGHSAIFEDDVSRLETRLDAYNADLPPLKDFILPGGGAAGAFCHLARTVCRRAERELVTLSHHDAVRPEAIRYLNRLSDLLFVLARVLARASGAGEVLWQHDRRA